MIELDDGGPSNVGLLPDSVIWTPEIERLNRYIIESLRMQSRGCAVMGQQCNGKSHATRYLMGLLPETLGHSVAVVRWTMRDLSDGKSRVPRTSRAFIQERMHQSGCGATSHRDEAVLWRRLFSHLAEMAIAAGSRWIVIIVDEAQNLLFKEYGNLIYIFNSLEDMNVKPFFMLTGQPELANAPASWKEMNGMQVIGRFFTRTYSFRGIAPEDFEVVLDGFDERAQDGQNVSVNLMPQVVGTDWSFGKWAPLFARAVEVLVTKHNFVTGLRLPMQMVRSTLLLLLARAIDCKLDPRAATADMVLTAMKDTGFTSSLAYYVDRSADLATGQEVAA